MKLYVDDVRDAPDGWVLARTVEEAKRLLATGEVISVSLDHDMGACKECSDASINYRWCPHVEDGYALVMWMIENNHVPPLVSIHSMNPVGRQRMIAALEHRHRHEAESIAPHVRTSRSGLVIEEP